MAISKKTNNSSVTKICTINICGLSSRSRFVLDKYVHDNDFDAVAVQETGTDDIESISLSNMTTLTDSNCAINRGAALYVKDQHSIAKLEEISQNFNSLDSCWGLTVINGTKYILGNVYVKLESIMGISHVISMLDRAQQLSSKIKAKGVILIGDMNARHQSWGDSTSNDYGKKLFKDLDSTKFTLLTANTPSFLCTNGSSFIDLVIISNTIVSLIDKIETDTNIELFSGAPLRGHVPVIVNLKTNSNEPSPNIKKLSIKDVAWNDWTNDIEQTIENSSRVQSVQEDPKMLLQFIENILNETTGRHGKIITLSSHSKPYWNAKLSELSKQLRIDRKNFTYRNTDSNKVKFLQSKDAFDQERKTACQEFIMEKTRNLNAVEAQKFWKEFKRITTRKTCQKINPLENAEGNILTDNEEIEELLFSTFFECKHMESVEFDEEFYHETNNRYHNIIGQDDLNSEEIIELNSKITTAELSKNIKEIKSSGKSFDNHSCHPTMIKKLGPKSLSLLLTMFNLCLSMTLWIWDTADVIFLKKAGKKSYSIPSSYRPISITAYLGKLLEKILAFRLIKFLKISRKFDPYQEGFTEKKNTIRYLNRLILDIKNDINNGKTVICLFLDFEKAFDSVWKNGLIVKLFSLGIKGKFLRLIDYFLKNRKVSLIVNGKKGKTRNCSEYGLPQGSVLSPILFKVFMMDFLEHLNENDAALYKFADDGSVKISANTTPECLIQLNHILESLDKWAKKWRMVINCQPNKTEVMCFGTAEQNRSLIPTEFSLGNQKIKLVKQTKVLGITIDEELSFKQHSAETYKKLITRWNLIKLYCNRNWGFNQRVMVELIRTLFVSCLMYGSHLWMDNQNMKEINSLYYKLLKTAVGPVFNIKQSIAEIILGLPPIAIQNKINQIKHYLKIIINDVPFDPLKNTIRNISSHDTSPELLIPLRSVFKFLKWKILVKPEDFSENDKTIISQNDFSKFYLLTQNSCKYTKAVITQYTELLWEDSLRNEFLAEGHSTLPKPSCKPLMIKKNLNRTKEVKLMSMFYENNLLNSFLFRRNNPAAPSPICSCGKEEQTVYHIVTRCELVNPNLRKKALNRLQSRGDVGETTMTLLNLSRDSDFMDTLSEIIDSHSNLIRTEVQL